MSRTTVTDGSQLLNLIDQNYPSDWQTKASCVQDCVDVRVARWLMCADWNTREACCERMGSQIVYPEGNRTLMSMSVCVDLNVEFGLRWIFLISSKTKCVILVVCFLVICSEVMRSLVG